MKSYGVTIQMKSLQQYFYMVLFIQYGVVTLESVDEILKYDHLCFCGRDLSLFLNLLLLPCYLCWHVLTPHITRTVQTKSKMPKSPWYLSQFGLQQSFHYLTFGLRFSRALPPPPPPLLSVSYNILEFVRVIASLTPFQLSRKPTTNEQLSNRSWNATKSHISVQATSAGSQ